MAPVWREAKTAALAGHAVAAMLVVPVGGGPRMAAAAICYDPLNGSSTITTIQEVLQRGKRGSREELGRDRTGTS